MSTIVRAGDTDLRSETQGYAIAVDGLRKRYDKLVAVDGISFRVKETITQYSPLTYVSDALRSISIDGASLWAVRTDLLGILAWLAVAVILATRLFKWEVV